MKKYIPTLIIVLSFLWISAVSMANSSEPDAVYQKMNKEFKLNPDGSVIYHYSHQLKLHSYFSFNRQYGETSVIYDPRFQKIKINYAYTIMSDGKRVDCPPNALTEVLPDFCTNAPAYNYLRRFVIVHTGLEKNATIFVDYEVITAKGYYPALMGNELLANYSSVGEENIIVKVPKDVQLKYKILNSSVSPVISASGDTSVYQWKFTNIPAMVPESQLPPVSAYAPFLLFSSSGDLNSLYKSFLNQDAFKNFANDKMVAWVKELRKSCKNETDFLLKLQEEIALNMKTYNVALNYTGYKLNNPVAVFEANGGTPLEKANLMCALLSYLDIKAYPVLSAYENLVDPQMGNLNVFNDVFVRVYTDPLKTLYFPMDRIVRQNQQFGLNDRKLLPLLADLKILNISTENNSDNFLSFDGSFKMKESGEISGKALIFARGCINPRFSFFADSIKTVSELISGLLPVKDKPAKFFELTQYQSNFEQEYSFSTALVYQQNEFLFIDFPMFPDGFEAWHLQFLNSDRTHPFYLPFPLKEHYNFSISLPKTITAVSRNYKIEKENDIGKISMVLTVLKNKVYIYREITLKKQLVNPTDYEKLKELLIPWLDKNKRVLVLKVVKK